MPYWSLTLGTYRKCPADRGRAEDSRWVSDCRGVISPRHLPVWYVGIDLSPGFAAYNFSDRRAANPGFLLSFLPIGYNNSSPKCSKPFRVLILWASRGFNPYPWLRRNRVLRKHRLRLSRLKTFTIIFVTTQTFTTVPL